MSNAEKIKEKLKKIKRMKNTLLLGGLMVGGTAVNAAPQADRDVNISESRLSATAVTKHLNNEYSQESHYESKDISTTINGVSKSQYSSAQQIRYDLKDGYSMVSSRVDSYDVVKQNRQSQFKNYQNQDVLYMTTPDGKTYDCSFLRDTSTGDYLPLGFDKDLFVKEDGQPDIELQDKIIKEVQEKTGATEITDNVVKQYNQISNQQKLKAAKDIGLPQEVISKINIYLQQVTEEIESNQLFLGTISNKFSDYSKTISSSEFIKMAKQRNI